MWEGASLTCPLMNLFASVSDITFPSVKLEKFNLPGPSCVYLGILDFAHGVRLLYGLIVQKLNRIISGLQSYLGKSGVYSDLGTPAPGHT